MYKNFYTTEMCPQGKALEKRFYDIKNALPKKKYVSLIGIVMAIILLTTSVFAGGVLNGSLIQPENEISVYKNMEKIELVNKPFIENGEVYFPIRELMNKFEIQDDDIIWSGGNVILSSVVLDVLKNDADVIGQFGIGGNSCTFNITFSDGEEKIIEYTIANLPQLKDGITYVPYELLTVINGEMQMLDGFYPVIMSEKRSDEKIYERLEKSVIWANVLKTREGKPRYDMMTDEMKEKFIIEQIGPSTTGDWYFRIGGSSPWVVNYDIELVDNNTYIIYHTADSGNDRYHQRESVTFEDFSGNLLASDKLERFEEYERVNAFAPTAEEAAEEFKNALSDSDYEVILSYLHDMPYEADGDVICSSMKISGIETVQSVVNDDEAKFILRINIADGGLSDLKIGEHDFELTLTSDTNGWYAADFQEM